MFVKDNLHFRILFIHYRSTFSLKMCIYLHCFNNSIVSQTLSYKHYEEKLFIQQIFLLSVKNTFIHNFEKIIDFFIFFYFWYMIEI